jgi:hypothetical protein
MSSAICVLLSMGLCVIAETDQDRAVDLESRLGNGEGT